MMGANSGLDPEAQMVPLSPLSIYFSPVCFDFIIVQHKLTCSVKLERNIPPAHQASWRQKFFEPPSAKPSNSLRWALLDPWKHPWLKNYCQSEGALLCLRLGHVAHPSQEVRKKSLMNDRFIQQQGIGKGSRPKKGMWGHQPNTNINSVEEVAQMAALYV